MNDILVHSGEMHDANRHRFRGEALLSSTGSRGFTLIELLLVIGLISVLASVVIVAINPFKNLLSGTNASRVEIAKQMENAVNQYIVDRGKLPEVSKILQGSNQKLPICRWRVSQVDCVNLDVLSGTYLPVIPIDQAETCDRFTGFSIYADKSWFRVLPSQTTALKSVGPMTCVDMCPAELSGYWQFDEPASPSTYKDMSGNGNDGSKLGADTASADVPSVIKFYDPSSRYFDGTTAVGLVASPTLNITGSGTFAAWIKTSQATEGTIIGGASVAAMPDPGYMFSIQSGKPAFWSSGNGNWLQASSTINNNAWHHIAVVFGYQVKFYIDGVQNGATFTGNGFYPSYYNGARILGARTDNSNHYVGYLDDVHIFDRALTAAEVQSLANGNQSACNHTSGSPAPAVPGATAPAQYCPYGNPGCGPAEKLTTTCTPSGCVPDPVTNITTVVGSVPMEGQVVTIGCPTGQVIRKMTSYYGLNTLTIPGACPSGKIGPGWGVCDLHYACIGMTACSITYANPGGNCKASDFDPCVGTIKDGTLSFLCGP